MNGPSPPPEAVERFCADLAAVTGDLSGVLGLAVSGGVDSLALLLLGQAACPGKVRAATVDHGLRPEAADEALFVAALCAELGVGHDILRPPVPITGNLQSAARQARYALLEQWRVRHGLDRVATAHHADDQAETLLMRLARGAGVRGLGGTRPRRALTGQVALVRPLLGWRKSELVSIVNAAGIEAVDDPSNRDPRHDRSRIRQVLERADWADPTRLAASASALRDADEALDWALAPLIAARIRQDEGALIIEPFDLPRELKRRLLAAAFGELGAPAPRGPDLMRAMDSLEAGQIVTLSGLKLEGSSFWRLSPAPPRRA